MKRVSPTSFAGEELRSGLIFRLVASFLETLSQVDLFEGRSLSPTVVQGMLRLG